MTEQTTPVEPGGEDPRAELAHSNEEVQRLRSLLIAKDAELGAVRGNLAILEQRQRYLLGILARLQRVPGLMGLARAVLRRLRGRRGSASA